jgi:hypothetical protein
LHFSTSPRFGAGFIIFMSDRCEATQLRRGQQGWRNMVEG